MKTKQTKPSLPESKRLGDYLTAAATLGTLASSADAAIVNLDVTSIQGNNGGVAGYASDSFNMSDFASGLGGIVTIYNNHLGLWGLCGDVNLYFAVNNVLINADPKNFSLSSPIGVGSQFSSNPLWTAFRYNSTPTYAYSLPFTGGAYMGFRAEASPGDYNYGWLEVTWDGTEEFFILSGAYESDYNTSILAGAVPGGGGSAIPEPASALSTLGLLASGMTIRRRSKKAA